MKMHSQASSQQRTLSISNAFLQRHDCDVLHQIVSVRNLVNKKTPEASSLVRVFIAELLFLLFKTSRNEF